MTDQPTALPHQSAINLRRPLSPLGLDLRFKVADALQMLDSIRATCRQAEAGEMGPEWASTIGLSAGIAEQGLREVLDDLTASAGLPVGGGAIMSKRARRNRALLGHG